MVLRVKLEVVPFGDEDRAYEIGRLDIFNKGPVVPDDWGKGWCRYGVIDLTPKQTGLCEAELTHWRKEGAWSLLRKILSHPQMTIEGP